VDHPSREELEAFCREELPWEQESEVLDHLLGCPQCLEALPPMLRALLGPAEAPLTPEEDAAYEAALDRAFEAARGVDRDLRWQKAQTERALKALEAGRQVPRNTDTLAHMDALLARSWQLRYEDLRMMAAFAFNAVHVSLRLDPRLYGPQRVCDHQAKAQAELGNAYRAANRFQEADKTLAEARRLFERGTRPPCLEIRLLELEASFLADLRKFTPAAEKLAKVLKFHTDEGDVHLAGRTLVLMGLYTGYSGNYELAAKRLRQSLKMIDAERDPGLACAAAHNIILFLVSSGHVREAKKLRVALSRHLKHPGGRVNEIRFRALEGRIDAELGNLKRAETIFREVKADYTEAGLLGDAGITNLDLAAVLLQQDRAYEAERIISEAAEIFALHRIRNEALQAVILLRDSFAMRTGTLEKILEVAAFLRRLEIDPALRFEPQAWETRPE
jgi:tetratricopeptide (TPR) repeat protein